MSGSLRAILRPQRLILRSGPQGPAGDAGGAGVTSVNGDEGPDVTLDAADVGADPAGTAAGLVAALGNSSTRNVGTTAGTVAAGDDSRLTDARTPTAHASTHASAGSDPLTPAAIGALATAGLGSVTQAWSANLDSYATTAPSILALSLLGQADAISWRIPLSTPRMRTANADPAAIDDLDHGYERGALWLDYVDGQVWVSTDSSTGAAVWLPILTSTSATATPTASKIPIADGSGKLAAGWIPTGSGGVQAWDADLDAYAASPATATPTASRIPVADGSGLLDGWISTASTSTAGLAKVRPTNITLMGRQTVIAVNNIPAAETEIPAAGAVRSTFDLTNFTQFRLKVNQVAASNSGSVCRVLYSTTPDGTPAIGTMSDLATTPTAGDCALSTAGTQTTQVGPWTNIAAGARADVQMALVTALGNAAADPTFRWGELELR